LLNGIENITKFKEGIKMGGIGKNVKLINYPQAGEFIREAWKGSITDVETLINVGSPTFVTHALATAANDFLVASGSGVFVKKTLADTRAILYATATPTVIDIPATTTRAIRIGTKGVGYSGGTTGNIAITSLGGTLDAEPANNYLLGVFTKVAGNESTSATDDLGSAWFRTRTNTGTTTPAGYSLYGAKSQLRIYSDSGLATSISNWAAAGLLGVLEVSGATTTFQSGCIAAAVYANVSLTTTTVIASGAVVAGVAAISASAAITDTGSAYYGVYVGKSGAVAFDVGLKITTSSCTTGIAIGTCTTGISLGGTITNAIDVTAAATLTNLVKFDAVAGCVVATDVNPKEIPSAGGLGADGAIAILIGSNTYYIPIFDALLT
jgi:hypothetical protein